jgi:thermitase
MVNRLALLASTVIVLACLALPALVSAGAPASPRYSELLIRFQPGLTRAQIRQDLAAHGLTQVEFNRDLDLSRVRAKSGTDIGSALETMKTDPRVLAIEPNYRVRIAGARVVPRPLLFSPIAVGANDPLFRFQWGLQRIQAPLVWLFAKENPVTIAVIDSGVDLSHPDLEPRIVGGFNFVQPGTPPQDDFWHGTHVSGIAAAVQNNHIGIAGTAVNVSIMPLKILDEFGEGTLEDLESAIRYASLHKARVANMSLGTLTDDNRCPPILQEQINFAHAHGVFLAAAAGNQGGTDPFFPAACKNVVAVTSTDLQDRLSYFDNTGNWIDIAAPGEDIISTVPGGEYDYASGTSMATPFVAGVAALAWSMNPNRGPDDIERILESSADRFGWMGHINTYGWGRIDAANLLGSSTNGIPSP